MSPSNRGSRTIGGDFTLVDHDGTRVSAATYAGRFALYFFGFTHCAMVCPRALSRWTAVLDRLGPLAEDVQPLYVTVDPARDTPAVMKRFLELSYPRFTGLTGSQDQIDAVKAAFHVFSSTVADPHDPNGYQMPHTAFSYLTDRGGKVVAHFTDAVPEDELGDRLTAILETLEHPDI